MDLSALSTSLPANANRTSTPPSETILDEFKNAALSVTRLYKAASKQADAARIEGYQNCLSDLLDLLDAEPHVTTIRAWALNKLDAAARERRAGSTEEENRDGREDMERDTAMETTNEHGGTDYSSMNMGMQYTQVETPTSSPLPAFQQTPTTSMSIPEMQFYPPITPPSAPDFTFRSDMRAPRHPPPPLGDTTFNLNNAARPHHVQQIRTPPSSSGHKRRFEIFEQAAASAERANNNAFKRNKML